MQGISPVPSFFQETQAYSPTLEKAPTISNPDFSSDLLVVTCLCRKALKVQAQPFSYEFRYILEVIERLTAHFGGPSNNGQSGESAIKADDFLAHFFSLLRQNADKSSFNVSQLCRQMAVSKAQMNRKVRDLTGKSVMENLRHLRLQKAAGLLLQTDSSIADIAYSSGFSDPNYFCRSFTRFFNCTPSRFRKGQID